jgi:hypothetical protein
VFPGVLLTVKVLTGTAASPIGNTAIQSSSTGVARSASVTTTVAGSQVYGAMACAETTAVAANSNSVLNGSQTDSTNGLDTGTCRSASATVTPGAVVIGFTNTGTGGGCALLEILANGTIAEDGSSPASAYSGVASSTVTTASFSPPGSSLLVAMVGADANTSTVVTVSDSSGLTWTQRVVAQTSGALYAAVWTALAPAAAVTGGAAAQPLIIPVLTAMGVA